MTENPKRSSFFLYFTLSRTESGAYDLAVAFPPSSPVIRGDELSVNVDATDGELVVEVIDESAVVARSAPLPGDQPNATVVWQDGNIADHEGTVVQLRFALRDASFYSFWFEVPEE